MAYSDAVQDHAPLGGPVPPIRYLVDVAEGSYEAGRDPCVVERLAPAQALVGIVDGAGCWGRGMDVAAWSRTELLRLWQERDVLSAARIADALALVAESIPAGVDDDFWSFSATFALLQDGMAEIVAAGMYGVDLVTDAGTIPLFRPRMLLDEFTERRMLSVEELAAFPHRDIVLEPAICSGDPALPVRCGPVELPEGACVLIADAPTLRELADISLPPSELSARTLQEIGASTGRARRPAIVVRRGP